MSDGFFFGAVGLFAILIGVRIWIYKNAKSARFRLLQLLAEADSEDVCAQLLESLSQSSPALYQEFCRYRTKSISWTLETCLNQLRNNGNHKGMLPELVCFSTQEGGVIGVRARAMLNEYCDKIGVGREEFDCLSLAHFSRNPINSAVFCAVEASKHAGGLDAIGVRRLRNAMTILNFSESRQHALLKYCNDLTLQRYELL